MKNSLETKQKRAISRQGSDAKHVFDLCGWEIWVDSLNYQIRKKEERFYWTTFTNMLLGLREELVIRSIKKSVDVDSAIKRVLEIDEKLVGDLKALLDSHTSLGELEWF